MAKRPTASKPSARRKQGKASRGRAASGDPIRFGTDGWRGRIAEDYTFGNLRRCTAGFAAYLRSVYSAADLKRGIVVGGDRRFHSENFAAAAAEVLAGSGIPVHYCGGGVPTPVISFSVKAKKAIGAINITASHNPPYDNGFKVRDENGGAIAPEGLAAIEALIPPSAAEVRRIKFRDAVAGGLIREFNADEAYIRQISAMVDIPSLKKAGLNILVDPMWGNGAGWFSRLLAGDATKITEIHSDRNPIFPEMSRPEPIHPNIDAGIAKGKEMKADVVIFTDGDADRCGFADEKGRFLDQLRVYGLLALYLLEVRKRRAPIVKTLSTTSMLDELGKTFDVPVYEVGVGFKYVAPRMMETNAMIGGEESGGYAFEGHVPERDGILAGLFFLDFMVKTGLKPSELLDRLFGIVGAHYYDRIDVTIEAGQKQSILKRLQANLPKKVAGKKVVRTNLSDGFKFILEDGSWLLVRFSGTEPLVRVYSEALSSAQLRTILREGERLVR
ncbi:MAG TPA: phosphoglucomutase/phosphomannomutase family protein [Bacteroidota bacterium]|nr:phosphoglucomutase/phosphomannomutase family protein [Bacteroidota bacterium]